MCLGCNTCYVGQTSQHLITQFKEHRYKCNQPVSSHLDKCTHCIPTSNDVKILAQASSSLNFLLTLEALHSTSSILIGLFLNLEIFTAFLILHYIEDKASIKNIFRSCPNIILRKNTAAQN